MAIPESSLEVRALEPRDIEATASLLAHAFDDDPAYTFLFPDRGTRGAGLADFFARNLRTHLPYRCTYVGLVDSRVVSTVTMRPPKGFSISVLTMIRRGLLPFALAHGARAVRRLFALKDAYDAIEGRLARGERHWLVHMMAVDPARQGTGVGTHLLGHVLESTVDWEANGTRPPALLTTHNERCVHFYERAGFERDDVEQVALLGEVPYPVWRMRRQAQRTSS